MHPHAPPPTRPDVPMQQTNVNTGVYFVRASEGGRHIMRGWEELKKTMSHENDQVRGYDHMM